MTSQPGIVRPGAVRLATVPSLVGIGLLWRPGLTKRDTVAENTTQTGSRCGGSHAARGKGEGRELLPRLAGGLMSLPLSVGRALVLCSCEFIFSFPCLLKQSSAFMCQTLILLLCQYEFTEPHNLYRSMCCYFLYFSDKETEARNWKVRSPVSAQAPDLSVYL